MPAGHEADQVADPLSRDPRPHLCRRHRADFAAVNALQAQYKLTPLSAYGKPLHLRGTAGGPESRLQHDRQAATGHRRNGHVEAYFNMLAQADGRRGAAGAGGRADRRAHGEDRYRSRPAVRNRQARPGRAGGVARTSARPPRRRSSPSRANLGSSANGWPFPKRPGHLRHRTT